MFNEIFMSPPPNFNLYEKKQNELNPPEGISVAYHLKKNLTHGS